MSGRVLASGRIGVDVSRAMDKLGDHLLADRTTWLCELARVAVLSSATEIQVDFDADDLYVRFDGDRWPAGALQSAAASLGVGGPGADRRGYLLVVALYSAAAQPGAAVELYTRTTAGSLEASRLDRGKSGRAARPRPKDGRDAASLCVHVELATTRVSLGRLVSRSLPAEVALMIDRLDEGAPPLVVNGERRSRAASPPLLTLPLEEDGLTLEVRRGTDAPAHTTYTELGVDLARSLWDGALGRAVGEVYAPLAARVRRERLLTNASRSRVDEELERRVRAALVEAIPRAVEGLTARAAGAPAVDGGGGDVGRDREAVAAMGALAACAAAADGQDPLVVPLEPLLELPLLWDATGRRRSVAGARRLLRSGGTIYLYEGEAPLSAEHLPFVRDVFWLRGETAEAYLRASPSRPYSSIAKDVKRGLERRARALAGPPTPLDLPACSTHVLLRREVAENGFRATLALTAGGVKAQSCTVRALVDGRLLETVELGAAPGGVPFDAVVEWPEVVVATRAYDGVQRGPGLDRALDRVARLARRTLQDHLRELPHHHVAALRPIAAAAMAARPESLRDVPLWPTLGSEALATTDALRRTLDAEGALRAVTPAEAVGLADVVLPASPVLILDGADRRALRIALGADVTLVPYAELLRAGPTRPDDLARMLRERPEAQEAPICWVTVDGVGMAAAPAVRSLVLFAHRGTLVHEDQPGSSPSVALAVEDERALPGGRPPASPDLRQVARALAAELCGRSDVDVLAAESGPTRAFLLSCVLDGLVVESKRLAAVPLFPWIEDGQDAGLVSAQDVAARSAGDIPSVEETPRPRVRGLNVVRASPRERDALAALSGRTVSSAAGLVERLRRRAARFAERDALLGRAKRAPGPPPHAHLDFPVVELPRRAGVTRAVAAVLADDVGARVAHASVLYEGRDAAATPLPTVEVPITLLIDVDRLALLPPSSGPRERQLRALRLGASCAVTELSLELLRGRGRSALEHEGCLSILTKGATGPGKARVLSALAKADVSVRTVQGDRAAWSLLTSSRVVRFGRDIHLPWPRAAEAAGLDAPILHLPTDGAGALLAELLAATGKPTLDVSAQLAALVEARREGLEPAAESLRDPPAHPKLRISLRSLRVPGLSGQVDLIPGSVSDLTLTRADEPSVRVTEAEVAALPCSVRGVVKLTGKLSRAQALTGLAVGLGRELRGLVDDLDALPPFVREKLRRHVVSELARGNRVAASVRAAPLFPSWKGCVSLAQVEAGTRADLPIAEHVQLARALGRKSPGAPRMSDADRASSIVVARVSRIGEGEVAIVHEGGSGDGVELRHLGCRIGSIERLLGFPARGALEVPVLLRAELEAEALDPARHRAILEAAESALVAALERMTAAPPSATARRFIDHVGRRGRVVGWAWLPDRNKARVVTPAGETRLDLSVGAAPFKVPVSGHLFVADRAEDPAMQSSLYESVWAQLSPLAATLPPRRAEELSAYLHLVGEPAPDAPPWARQVRESVARGVPLVVRLQSSELTFSPLVVGAEHPLGRALALFAPARSFRLLDDTFDAFDAKDTPPAPREGSEGETELSGEATTPPASPEAPASAAADFGEEGPPPRLLDSLLALFGAHPVWNAPASHPLVRHLEHVLPRLPIPPDIGVSFSRGGRPIRYEGGRVVIDPKDPVVLALAQTKDFASIAAAIVSEVNRALDSVTNAEEARALQALLLET